MVGVGVGGSSCWAGAPWVAAPGGGSRERKYNTQFAKLFVYLGKGPKKNVKMWSLTITGGGSARTTPLLQNFIVFLNIMYIFNYIQFIVVPQ